MAEIFPATNPVRNASYKTVIDALDEALINSVKSYALLKLDPEEEEWINKQRD